MLMLKLEVESQPAGAVGGATNPTAAAAQTQAQRPEGATYANANGAELPTTGVSLTAKRILLRTATVWAKSRSGIMKLRCLLDTGCQRTIIRDAVVKKLGLKVVGTERCQLLGLGGTTDIHKVRRGYELQLQARDVNGQPGGDVICLYALTVDEIGVPVPHAPAGSWLEELIQDERLLADEVDAPILMARSATRHTHRGRSVSTCRFRSAVFSATKRYPSHEQRIWVASVGACR